MGSISAQARDWRAPRTRTRSVSLVQEYRPGSSPWTQAPPNFAGPVCMFLEVALFLPCLQSHPKGEAILVKVAKRQCSDKQWLPHHVFGAFSLSWKSREFDKGAQLHQKGFSGSDWWRWLSGEIPVVYRCQSGILPPCQRLPWCPSRSAARSFSRCSWLSVASGRHSTCCAIFFGSTEQSGSRRENTRPPKTVRQKNFKRHATRNQDKVKGCDSNSLTGKKPVTGHYLFIGFINPVNIVLWHPLTCNLWSVSCD